MFTPLLMAPTTECPAGVLSTSLTEALALPPPEMKAALWRRLYERVGGWNESRLEYELLTEIFNSIGCVWQRHCPQRTFTLNVNMLFKLVATVVRRIVVAVKNLRDFLSEGDAQDACVAFLRVVRREFDDDKKPKVFVGGGGLLCF